MEVLNNIITEKECYQILNHDFDDVQVISYEIKKADNNIIGYLGEHFRLKIVYKKNTNILEEKSFFLKTKPIFNKTQAEYVQEIGLFRKESLLYKNILNKLSAICGKLIAPQCYLTKENCMVFDDLSLKKFAMKNDYLNLRESKCLVEALAKFHSATIIFEELNSLNDGKFRMTDRYENELQETAISFIDGKPRNKWLKNVTKCIEDFIKILFPENSRKLNEKLNEIVSKELEVYISPSLKYRNTVTHCDLWRNNFMMNDKLEVILIDFQLARYCPPAYDLLLTLFLNVPKKCLDENLTHLVELYYETFVDMLRLNGISAREVFPEHSFMESIEEFKLPTLIEAAFFLTNTLLSPETSKYITKDDKRFYEFAFTNRSIYALKEFNENPSFREGFMEILTPLVNLLNTKL